jgi:hypothetical protein
MKIIKITTLLVLGSAGSLLVSCGQKQQSVPEPPAKAEQAPEVPAAATTKPTDMPTPAVATAPVTDQAQGLIDKVKGLIAEKKYTEALAALKDLSALKLTEEQQKIVSDLKAQIEKAMQAQATSEATKSVGGLLGK